MTLRFDGEAVTAMLEEARRDNKQVALVKDQGVYLMVRHGHRNPDGTLKSIVYADGCNPAVDAFDDWWALARHELGGDDSVDELDVSDFDGLHLDRNDLLVEARPDELVLEAAQRAT